MGLKSSKEPIQKSTMEPIQKSTEKPIQKFKIVFLSDQSVGKSSIINRFIFNNFSENYEETMGLDFIAKTVQVNNISVRFLCWDTAGQERFRTFIPSYVRDSQATIICYDITDEKSFQNIPYWIEIVKAECEDKALIYILGNKTDLEQNRQVPTDKGEAKAKELGAYFFEVSAKSEHNIAEFFKKLSYDVSGTPYEQEQLSVQQEQLQQSQEELGQQLTENENENELLKQSEEYF